MGDRGMELVVILDMNFITQFFKSNINYIQPQGHPSTPPTLSPLICIQHQLRQDRDCVEGKD
jgi:hypothetical protein